jgi:DNA-binding transcriptional LysR family regulator
MLNPSWLNTFATLIDEGHFTKTAQKLHMTQPGVSQHIKKLEQACGHQLIKRESKCFTVTEQGRLVYDYAIQLLANELRLLESLNSDEHYVGVCKVACSDSLAMRLYPQCITLQIHFPELIIELEAAANADILSRVQNSDIGLGIVSATSNHDQLSFEQIGEESLCLILPANATIQPDIDNTLKNLGLICHPNAEHYLSLYLAGCGIDCLKNLSIDDIPKSGYVNQINQILLPVASGLGFTLLPQSALENLSCKHLVKTFNPKREVIKKLYAVTALDRQLAARYTCIIKSFKSTLAPSELY